MPHGSTNIAKNFGCARVYHFLFADGASVQHRNCARCVSRSLAERIRNAKKVKKAPITVKDHARKTFLHHAQPVRSRIASYLRFDGSRRKVFHSAHCHIRDEHDAGIAGKQRF